MRLRLVADAASEPFTVTDVMPYIRVDIDPNDGVMLALIKAARRRVEKVTGLALLTQTWTAVMDKWPDTQPPDYRSAGPGSSSTGLGWWSGVQQGAQALIVPNGMVEILKRPFQAITQIQTRDVTGAFTTLDSSTYYTEVSDYQGRLMRKPGVSWPPIPANMLGAIEITFTCGFGASQANVPDELLLAMRMLISHWHENREPISTALVSPVPQHVTDILQDWVPMRLR